MCDHEEDAILCLNTFTCVLIVSDQALVSLLQTNSASWSRLNIWSGWRIKNSSKLNSKGCRCTILPFLRRDFVLVSRTSAPAVNTVPYSADERLINALTRLESSDSRTGTVAYSSAPADSPHSSSSIE